MSVPVSTPVSVSVSVAIPMMPPFLVGFMLIMPMVPVTIIMAVTNEFLTMRISPEMIIASPVFFIMKVRLGFIHDYFMTMEKIIPTIPGR
jgi:hypothetical protein